jgi:hypothetical protein
MALLEVDRRGQNTATVVIAVGVGDIILALRKPATESSTYCVVSFVLTVIVFCLIYPLLPVFPACTFLFAFLQTTADKDEPNIVFYAEIVAYITTLKSEHNYRHT